LYKFSEGKEVNEGKKTCAASVAPMVLNVHSMEQKKPCPNNLVRKAMVEIPTTS